MLFSFSDLRKNGSNNLDIRSTPSDKFMVEQTVGL